MHLSAADWVITALYFAINLGIGFLYMRRAYGNVSEFFLSGRCVPWWLAGTSMIATTFGADTPLVVTGLVYSQGLQGNWLWWSFGLSGMLTLFFLAPLWRRAQVLTDIEFAEIRYAGKPSAFLRGFRALYLGLPVNTIIMGWVNLAMAKVLALTLGFSKLQAVCICLTVTLVYTAISGLSAVLWTDVVQCVIQMSMVVLLAYFAVKGVGGMDSLIAKVQASDARRGTHTLIFFPHPGETFFLSFLVLLSLNWWASWYPGAEPGGGYIAQRIFSAKNEKHALGATLWFNLAHYAIRPWPWILTALVALVLLPAAGDREGAYIQVMLRFLPSSLRGLMLAGFAAAYMSTIGTHLNLGASYLVNDVYRRFLVNNKSDHHYVQASRIATLFCAVLSGVATYYMDSISAAWRFLIAIGAGAGLVFILRWFWWRINAWSEIAAMTSAGIISLILQSKAGLGIARALHDMDPRLPIAPLNTEDSHAFAWLMLLTTGFTTLVWISVTLLTPAEPEVKLQSFYDLVRPPALGWSRFAPLSARASNTLRWTFLHWVLGFTVVYSTLFGIGNLLFHRAADGLLLILLAATCVTLLFRSLNRRKWSMFR